MSLVADVESDRLLGKAFGFISYLANFANYPPGITYHRIGKMRTLGSLWKKWRRERKQIRNDEFRMTNGQDSEVAGEDAHADCAAKWTHFAAGDF